MDDQNLVAWALQGEASWLGGQIAVLFSILCRIAHHEERGKTFAEALELTLKKYNGRARPSVDARQIAALVHDPELFLRKVAMLGYYFDLDDPMPFAMGYLCDVKGKRRDGDAIFLAPDNVNAVHLYRQNPIPFAEQAEPEPRPPQGELEMDL